MPANQPAPNKTPLSTMTRHLHWVVAIFMISLLAVGTIMDEFGIYSLYPIHKSMGVIAFIFILWRVVWRIKKGWPQPVSQYHKHEQRLSKLVHWVLIIGTLLMPISGMIMSGFGGHGVAIFGLELVAENYANGNPNVKVPIDAELSVLGSQVHAIVGKVLIAAILLHVTGALKHHIIDKDNTLRRMLGMQLK